MFDGHINRAYHCARAIEKWVGYGMKRMRLRPLGNAFHAPDGRSVPHSGCHRALSWGISVPSGQNGLHVTLARSQLGCPSGKRCGG